MIVEGWPEKKEEMIDKYLNVNLIFDVGTNNERCVTMVKNLWGLDGRSIGNSHTNPFFDRR